MFEVTMKNVYVLRGNNVLGQIKQESSRKQFIYMNLIKRYVLRLYEINYLYVICKILDSYTVC